MRFSSRSLLAIAFGAFVFAAATLWPSPARAQSVTLAAAAVTRNLPLPGRNQYNWVNFNDCEQDLVLTFPLVLDGASTGNSSLSLQAWAGASGATCTDLMTRNGQSTQTCWQIYPGNIPKSQTDNRSIPVRDILSQYATGATTKTAYGGPYGESVCHSSTSSGPATITLWFFMIDTASGNLAGTGAQFPLLADLVGPAPPTNLSAAIGNQKLILNWTPSGDTDTASYNFYCDPPPFGKSAPEGGGATVTTDAATTTTCVDGGLDDGGFDEAGDALPGNPLDGGCTTTTTPGTTTPTGPVTLNGCTTSVLVPAQASTTSTNEAGQSVSAGSQFIDDAYKCGSAGSVSSSNGVTDKLENYKLYNVAVAGIDNYGNTGILSTPGCNTPQEIIDFWQEYRTDGGLAGGGFCSIDGVGVPATATPLVVFGGWAIATVLRRRRKKK